jgi:hypothetical protein
MLKLLLLLPLALHGGLVGFTHVGNKSGVDVYRQMSSPVIDLVAEGDIEAPPSVVRDIILDYENAPAITDHVTESRVLSRNQRELFVYQRMALPVISDRDFTLHTVWGARAERLWIRSAVDSGTGPATRDGIVRLSVLNGSWELVPVRDGTATHAVYQLQLDLAGSVPRWMVSGGAVKSLPALFDGIRHQAAKRGLGVSVSAR